MAVYHGGLPALAAAAVTAGVLAGGWWFTRALRNAGHGASAARAPWRRTAPSPAGAGAGHERVASLHAAFLDRTDDRALRATDAHLEQYWENIVLLYPSSDTNRSQS
ncbi:hypothetical protein [Streptomyces antarcticus]|uniref:hypothetical protein n=1 Tax=Streptomyces antarcticus TaxID=2996458 RepID=UPI00226F051F|nr:MULTISPECIES: hypothetical protein [unclassified Streptomyces]MCY0943290.1 hypothetical protein [Streptomyces sp. H34-AA3]MCZ4082520.1 hypothetical protein [Streptomyces sp. H34-S5]